MIVSMITVLSVRCWYHTFLLMLYITCVCMCVKCYVNINILYDKHGLTNGLPVSTGVSCKLIKIKAPAPRRKVGYQVGRTHKEQLLTDRTYVCNTPRVEGHVNHYLRCNSSLARKASSFSTAKSLTKSESQESFLITLFHPYHCLSSPAYLKL